MLLLKTIPPLRSRLSRIHDVLSRTVKRRQTAVPRQRSSRRAVTLLLFSAGIVGALASQEMNPEAKAVLPPSGASDRQWLEATELIDLDAPSVRSLSTELTEGARSERERALRIYRFVRDEIQFGWTGAFYDMSASDVLSVEKGFSLTKGALFVALLRSAGIPARQRFVDLRSDLLYGLVQTGGAYIDHSYSEVLLDGKWLRVDSYTVDSHLYDSARARLEREGRELGYGIHRQGVNDWDGTSDSFAQFVDDGSVERLSNRDFGVFADVHAFYSSVEGTWNRRAGLDALAHRILLPVASRNVERVRSRGAVGRPGPRDPMAGLAADVPAR